MNSADSGRFTSIARSVRSSIKVVGVISDRRVAKRQPPVVYPHKQKQFPLAASGVIVCTNRKKTKEEKSLIADTLQNHFLFRTLFAGQDESSWLMQAQLVDAFEKVTIEPNAYLQRQNDPAEYFYLLVNGGYRPCLLGTGPVG
jgi:hypothetical protein